jgi:hypothetical protein
LSIISLVWSTNSWSFEFCTISLLARVTAEYATSGPNALAIFLSNALAAFILSALLFFFFLCILLFNLNFFFFCSISGSWIILWICSWVLVSCSVNPFFSIS